MHDVHGTLSLVPDGTGGRGLQDGTHFLTGGNLPGRTVILTKISSQIRPCSPVNTVTESTCSSYAVKLPDLMHFQVRQLLFAPEQARPRVAGQLPQTQAAMPAGSLCKHAYVFLDFQTELIYNVLENQERRAHR